MGHLTLSEAHKEEMKLLFYLLLPVQCLATGVLARRELIAVLTDPIAQSL